MSTTEPIQTARVRFRQPVSEAGYVDAAWWPRSRDLAVEFPQLLEVLWTAAREITRISYNIADWDPAPRQIAIGGRIVRLGGFHTGARHEVRLSDAWRRERIDMLVVEPGADATVADRAMSLAGEADGTHRADEILTLAGTGKVATSKRSA